MIHDGSMNLVDSVFGLKYGLLLCGAVVFVGWKITTAKDFFFFFV